MPEKKIRPSPTESATEFEEGTIQTGNDGNEYIVAVDKNGRHRWAKHKTEEKPIAPKKVKMPEPEEDSKAEPEPVKVKKTRAPKKTKEPEPEPEPVPEQVKAKKTRTTKKTKEAERVPTPEPEEEAPESAGPSNKKSTRKAPMEPAKNHDDGYEMEGLDGRMFVVRTAKNGVKRWIAYH